MKTQRNSTRVKAPANISPDVQACPTNSGTNDDASLNPKGREATDGKNKGKNLLSCKSYHQFATFNTRTLRTADKRPELANNFNKYRLSALGIVDHKIVHEDDPILVQQLDNCTLITTSAWRNSNGAACGGVGIVVSKDAEQALADIKPINKRILTVYFGGNPSTTMVINYLFSDRRERKCRRIMKH